MMRWRFRRGGTWMLMCYVTGPALGVGTQVLGFPFWASPVAVLGAILISAAFVYGCFVDIEP